MITVVNTDGKSVTGPEVNGTGVDIDSTIVIASDVVVLMNTPLDVDAMSDTTKDGITVDPGICTA